MMKHLLLTLLFVISMALSLNGRSIEVPPIEKVAEDAEFIFIGKVRVIDEKLARDNQIWGRLVLGYFIDIEEILKGDPKQIPTHVFVEVWAGVDETNNRGESIILLGKHDVPALGQKKGSKEKAYKLFEPVHIRKLSELDKLKKQLNSSAGRANQ